MPDVQSWAFQDASGSVDRSFYNAFSGGLDDWSRQFTPEESGGFARTMTKNRKTTFSITPGIRGKLSNWNYELSYNHSEYRAKVEFPQIIAAKANALFHLPAGPVGVAMVGEAGKQGYDLKPVPKALVDYDYSLKDSNGKGIEEVQKSQA